MRSSDEDGGLNNKTAVDFVHSQTRNQCFDNFLIFKRI